ncbi:MAG: class I SAM-dependent methyltransferase, partial [Caldilineales bacterium]|nr:class I SAM-dependent methyltransferase [Caldilineales bacterium]
MKPVATIRQHFNDFAPRYDNHLTAFVGERELRQIRPLVPAGSLVLDYGCGTGRTTLDLLRRGCTVTAYDISTGMLDQAITKAARLNLTAEFISDPAQLSGREWPVITCIGVLDYYPEPGPLLELLKGYMAPGGLLVVTYPNAYSPWGWLYAAA